MYQIIFTLVKGQGMIAEKHIKPGTRILAEDVLFSIADNTVDEGLEERISQSYKQMVQKDQDLFDSLHCPDHPEWSPLVSRYLANNFELRTKTPDKGQPSGIFMKASRINHSCCPNAFFAWNPKLGQLTIHAILDIPPDKEITIAYDIPFQSRDNRREKLLEIYRFQCRCPACRFDRERGCRSEERRRRMESLWWEVDEDEGPPRADDDKGYQMIQEFIELALLEDLDGEFLSSMYELASMHAEVRGSKEDALAFAILENKTDRRLLGEDHPVTMESTIAVAELKYGKYVNELRRSEQGDGDDG